MTIAAKTVAEISILSISSPSQNRTTERHCQLLIHLSHKQSKIIFLTFKDHVMLRILFFFCRLSQGYSHPQTPNSPFLPLYKFYAILPHQSCQSKNSCNNKKKITKSEEFRNTENILNHVMKRGGWSKPSSLQ